MILRNYNAIFDAVRSLTSFVCTDDWIGWPSLSLYRCHAENCRILLRLCCTSVNMFAFHAGRRRRRRRRSGTVVRTCHIHTHTNHNSHHEVEHKTVPFRASAPHKRNAFEHTICEHVYMLRVRPFPKPPLPPRKTYRNSPESGHACTSVACTTYETNSMLYLQVSYMVNAELYYRCDRNFFLCCCCCKDCCNVWLLTKFRTASNEWRIIYAMTPTYMSNEYVLFKR